ncbi:MAG: hypothetical protein P1V51_22390 [Deltaproteobacteria bacterium]|nr:hypothetical protein [Deltaproteobacteria bacterium]
MQQTILMRNAELVDMEADDIRHLGGLEAQRIRLVGRELEGRQVATFAAGNVDLSGGTPAAVVAQTAAYTELDAAIARVNASRAAWAKEREGENLRFQGLMARKAGDTAAFATLLSGGAQAAGAAYGYYGKR